MSRCFPLARAWGWTTEGPALVIRGGFSPRYHLDRATGTFRVRGHPFEGKTVAGMILICDFARGGVAAGWALYAMHDAGVAPRALIFGVSNPVMVQGALFAGIPIADGLADEAWREIGAGQWVRLNVEHKVLQVLRSHHE